MDFKSKWMSSLDKRSRSPLKLKIVERNLSELKR